MSDAPLAPPYRQIEKPGKTYTAGRLQYALGADGVAHIAWFQKTSHAQRLCYSQLANPEAGWSEEEVVDKKLFPRENQRWLWTYGVQTRPDNVPCVAWTVDTRDTFSSIRRGQEWSKPVKVLEKTTLISIGHAPGGALRAVLDTAEGIVVCDGDGETWTPPVSLGLDLKAVKENVARNWARSNFDCRAAATADGAVRIAWIEWAEDRKDTATVRYAHFLQTIPKN